VLKPSEPAETESLNTGSLLASARAGDADAFCELCRTLESRLVRQAMSLCGNAGLAEELAQETLVEAWKCLRRFNGRCQFFTWVCAILHNRYRNTLREKHPIPFSILETHTGDEVRDSIAKVADSEPLPDETAQRREQARLVGACLDALPGKHQQVIYLRFYVDDSLEGIAGALGCSVGTVKSRLFHALEKLRRMNVLSGEFTESRRKLEYV
jgi:RNA polymerase sigma-70 factor (ECF subfamily)